MSDVKTEAEKLIAEVRVLPEVVKAGVGWFAMDGYGVTYSPTGLSIHHDEAFKGGWAWRGPDEEILELDCRPDVDLDKYPEILKHTKFKVTAKDLASYTDLTSTAGECQEREECEEIVTNASGGKSAKVRGRYDLIPPEPIQILAEVFQYGNGQYPPDEDGNPNWWRLTAQEHYNHAMNHMLQELKGDKSEYHAAHALCRMTMYLWKRIADEEASPIYWRSNAEVK